VPSDYQVGSAKDPDPENRQQRAAVEQAVRDTLMSAGVSEFLAIETAGAVVSSYLATGSEEAVYVIKHLGNAGAVRQAVRLRTKAEAWPDVTTETEVPAS